MHLENLRPLYDQVIILPDEAEEVTDGGLIIPDVARQLPHRGIVVAAGPGRIAPDGTPIPLAVKSGDCVLYGRYSCTQVEIDGTLYLIGREGDIHAVYTPAEVEP